VTKEKKQKNTLHLGIDEGNQKTKIATKVAIFFTFLEGRKIDFFLFF